LVGRNLIVNGKHFETIFLQEIATASHEDAVVIDIGCGKNKYLRQINVGLGLGLDLKPYPEAKGTNFVVGTSENLPLKDGCCDLVIAHSVLEHLKNPAATVKEVYRVLRESACFIFATPHRYYPASLASNVLPISLKTRLVRFEIFPTYYRCNTLRAVRKTLIASGLKEVNVFRTYEPIWLKKVRILNLLLWPINQLYESRFRKTLPPHHLVGLFMKNTRKTSRNIPLYRHP
jgi:SAM-dependent methyltransferase